MSGHTWRGGRRFALVAVLALVMALLAAPAPAAAAVTVTDCGSDVALRAAVAAGGVITIDCGGPATIALTGALELAQDAELDGRGDVTLSGVGTEPVLQVDIGVTASVRGLTLSGGGSIAGGGILNMGALTVEDSTISGNGAFIGGGIGNIGTLTLSGSLVSDNAGQSEGGGVFNDGSMTIVNSTIAGNTSILAGGGVANNGVLFMFNSTVVGNSASVVGGLAIESSWAGSNNIVAGNTGGDCDNVAPSAGDHNISGDASCGFTQPADQQNVTPVALNLGPLQDNGGPTETLLPETGSVAIDAGDDAVCANDPVAGLDQRGFLRPAGAHCDIGAVEAGAVETPALSGQVRGIAVLRQSCGDDSATGACLEWLVGLDVNGAPQAGVQVTASVTTPDGATQTVSGETGRFGSATLVTPVDSYGTYTLTVTRARLGGAAIDLSGPATRSIAVGGRFRR